MIDDGKMKGLQTVSRATDRADHREREFNRLVFGFTLATIFIFVGLIASLVAIGLLLLWLLWPKF